LNCSTIVPPLRLLAEVNHGNGASFPVTVIVNHLRSLNDVDNPGPGSNGWPTSGARVRAKRLAQAVDLANLVQARQTADPNERIVLIGDFNAFQFNDGLVDSLNVISGTPTPDNETAVPGDGVDLVNPDFTNLVTTLASGAAYSFVFDGSAQFLDHVLANAPLLTGTLAQRVEHPMFNADFPETDRGNAAIANRVSDHDPLLAVFKVAAFGGADLAITKTDGVATAAPGGSVTYTITASNGSTAPATGATVADTFPAVLSCTWTCTGAGGGTCTPSGSGNISDSVNLPAGGSVTYTAACSISAFATGTLSNTATVTLAGDPDLTNNSATDTDTLLQQADLAITKTDGVATATPGGSVTYTLTASNAGPSNAFGATVADTFPAVLSCSWTCAGAGGGTCTPSGSGNLNDTVNLPSGGSVTYTASCSVAGNATGTLSNTATVTAPNDVIDPNAANNSATDTDTLTGQADLSITKVDTPDPVTAGGNLTYTISVSNAGPSDAATVSLSDTLPAGTTYVSLSSPGGWSCTTPAVGSAGTVSCSITSLAPGSAVFTLVVKVGNEVTGGTVLSNTATVASATSDPNPGNESATATTTVNAAPTTTAVTSSLNPSFTGQSVTFTATVTAGGNPVTMGTVTFSIDGTPQAPAVSLDGAGQAALTTNTLTEGTHSIVANYSGAGGFSASSGSLTQTVNTATVVNGNTYCNPGGISIPAGTSTPVLAAPYPSRIFVTGFSGTLSKVTLSLNNFTHEAPNDLSFMLVGPNGNRFVFLSGAGGASPVSGLNVTFDDAAASAVAGLATGTYKPTAALTAGVNFPAPAPAAPNFAAPAEAGTFASNFNGIDPNGTWSLFVVDQTSGATIGSIGEWCLTFTATCPSITVGPVAAASAVIGQPYALDFGQTGGALPVTFAVTAGMLPPGLLLNGNTLSGVPAQVGSFDFTIGVTDDNGCTGSRNYTLVVGCPTVSLDQVTLPSASLGTPFSQLLTASPAGTYTFAVTGGALPPGLSLSNSGMLTGTATVAGNFVFTVTATSFGLCSGSRTYTLAVINLCPTITIEPASLPDGTVGTDYNAMVTANGGSGPFNYGVTAGALPTGLVLNSVTGQLMGQPKASGSFSFTLTATGAGGCAGSRSYTLVIACPPLVFSPASLPNAQAGVAYNQSVTATGATSYSLVSGNLPPGLTLNTATGALTGTATATGTYNFSLLATAAGGCSGSQAYTLAVVCPALTISPATLSSATVGTAYSQVFSAVPAGNYTFALSSGTLPNGLTLSSAGVLSGTPTAGGSFNFTVQATGFGGCQGAKMYTLVINVACPTITLPALTATGKVGVNYFSSLAGTTPSGSYTFTVESGALPPGLVINNLFGALSGKPTTPGTYSFTLKATRINNCSGTQAYTIVISNLANAVTRFSDFDGDGKSDLSVWRGEPGDWLVWRSSDSQASRSVWGSAQAPYFDVIAPGDYDGDGLADLAVYRRSEGRFYVKGSRNGTVQVQDMGVGNNVPVSGDYDGDGQSDFAVWQPATGNWLIKRSSDGELQTINWGAGYAPYNDVAIPGDYDGDGLTDLAVYRKATGIWFILRSSDGGVTSQAWGAATDVPVAGDYDGDGKADLAVWRGANGNWYVLRSSDNTYRIISWGALSVGDVPVPGDYDGDGKLDYAVWREPEGRWYVLRSSDGATQTQQHGQAGDQPLIIPTKP
jgi:uncharacterized repeat protein (TIGR01451 family)